LRVRLGVLGRERTGSRHSGFSNLSDPLADELRLDRLGVDLLHSPGCLDWILDRDDLLQLRSRVVIAGPETLEIHHTEPTELPDLDSGGWRHHRVHRCSNHRE